MIADDLKSRIDSLSPEDRHELAVYLAKLELEDNAEFWESVRKRANEDSPSHWIPAEQL
jgi:hypothetical protein